MRQLKLVKKKEDVPRRGRGASVSSERRYRYPADELWEVCDDRWHVPETPPARTDVRKDGPESGM